jgi:hypothetical protein
MNKFAIALIVLSGVVGESALQGCGSDDAAPPQPDEDAAAGAAGQTGSGGQAGTGNQGGSTGQAGSGGSDAGPGSEDAQVDSGVALSAQCKQAGGVQCLAFRFEVCPAGLEPVASTPQNLGCGTGALCCQTAPSSSCSDSGLGNCLAGGCSDAGCWVPLAPDTGLTCESGRTCCQYACN